MLTGDLQGARQWCERAVEVGSRCDAAVCAVGRVAAAWLRILDGDVDEGLALLDEVGVAAVSGDLDRLLTGLVYCELVCALQGLAQYDVAEEWTQAMERWCQINAIGSLHGRCRVHRAEILKLRGACDEAEREALVACEELSLYLRREMGWPLSKLGRIRLRKATSTAPEEASWPPIALGGNPSRGLALVRRRRETRPRRPPPYETRSVPRGFPQGAATRQRPAARAPARGAGRDRNRGRRARPSPCRGRRAGTGGRRFQSQAVIADGAPGSGTDAGGTRACTRSCAACWPPTTARRSIADAWRQREHARTVPARNVGRPISASLIDHDDLNLDFALGLERREAARQVSCGVERRNDRRDVGDCHDGRSIEP
jgi:hypothetical protein